MAAQRSGKAATTSSSYLSSGEVADLLYVSPKTVARWAKEGKLPQMKTLRGHRRYPEAEIRKLVTELREEPTVQAVQSFLEGHVWYPQVGDDYRDGRALSAQPLQRLETRCGECLART